MKIQRMRPSRTSSVVCDNFTSWEDNDGERHQGFIHDTGKEVWYHGEWIAQYQYPDGYVFPNVRV